MRLEAFKAKVRQRTIKTWKNKEDLHGKFAVAIQAAINTHPRAGWVPSGEAASAQTLGEMTRLSQEVARLRQENQRLGGDEQEAARQDRVLAELDGIKSFSFSGSRTLLEVFKSVAEFLITRERVDMIGGPFQGVDTVPLAQDLRRLVSYGVVVSVRRDPNFPTSDENVLSELGSSILRRWERENIKRQNATK